jgi:hypothetical protein
LIDDEAARVCGAGEGGRQAVHGICDISGGAKAVVIEIESVEAFAAAQKAPQASKIRRVLLSFMGVSFFTQISDSPGRMPSSN